MTFRACLRIRTAGAVFAATLLCLPSAFAQGEEADEPAAGEANGDSLIDEVLDEGIRQGDTDDQPGVAGVIPESGEDKLQEFELQRGFYASGDLGIFITLSGVRPPSKLQPYMGIKAGYDLNDFLGVQLSISSGYNSSNPANDYDDPLQYTASQGGRAIQDFSLLNLGGELVFSLRPIERLAIEVKGGGGITNVYPEITDADAAAGGGMSAGGTVVYAAWQPHVTGGVDFKYLTLLTGFNAGATLQAYYLPTPGVLGMAIALGVRYTF